ncbi:TonB-dependent receptor SusC [anaerobic digester metagenome]
MNHGVQFLKKLPVIMLFMVSSLFAMGQDITITGTITDGRDGSPMIGVTILQKGTTNGTTTDLSGAYSLKAPKDAILVFSFIGYETIEQPINGRTAINVTLNEATESLDEVIVIGYGVQKKSDKTGAVANVKAEELNKGIMQDPIQSLAGKTAGVLITKKGGDPNAGFSVKIRSQASLFAGTEPLYVVDGVPGVDPTTINSDDIESFNVLKDASSSAIYGANGANGVVIITTKKGTKGSETIEFSSTVSFDKIAKKLDMMSAKDIREYVSNYGLSSNFVDGGANVDWQDQIYRTGVSQAYSTAFSGGSDIGNFRASLSHTINEGIILGSDKTRTIGRLNFNRSMYKNRLVIASTISGTKENNSYVKYDANGRQDVIYQALQRNPTDPIRDSEGNYYETNRDFGYVNPLGVINDLQNEREAKRLMGNITSTWEIFKGLKHWLSLSYARDDDEKFIFEPLGTYSAPEGSGKREYNNKETKTLESTLNYTKDLFSNHNLNVTLGYSYQHFHYSGISAYGKGPTSNTIKAYNIVTLANIKQGDITSYYNNDNKISFFGRAIYNIDSKYIVTATLRRDGSSKFGKNNRWGYFPSASVAWNIKSEPFLENVNLIEQLKLRVGYGVAGNDNFDSNAYRPIIRPDGNTFDYETGTYVPRYTSNLNANPDLKWEENKEFNIGLDWGLFSNKVNGTFEFYKRTTDDLLVKIRVEGNPAYSYPELWINAGSFESSGFEANIQYHPFSTNSFSWKTQLSFSTFTQKIVKLNKDWSENNNKRGWLQGRGLVGENNWALYIKEGWELGTFYMPEYAGLSQDGAFLFYTASGGVTRDVSKAERRILGSANPDFELGWSNYFTLGKSFDFSFAFRGVFGGEVLNVTRLMLSNPSVLPNTNALKEAISEKALGVTSRAVINSRYLESGTFIRLENINLGYNVNVFKAGYNLRVAITANNLFVITKYKGTDPEITYTGLDYGLDNFNVYPKTRSVMLGVTLTL